MLLQIAKDTQPKPSLPAKTLSSLVISRYHDEYVEIQHEQPAKIRDLLLLIPTRPEAEKGELRGILQNALAAYQKAASAWEEKMRNVGDDPVIDTPLLTQFSKELHIPSGKDEKGEELMGADDTRRFLGEFELPLSPVPEDDKEFDEEWVLHLKKMHTFLTEQQKEILDDPGGVRSLLVSMRKGEKIDPSAFKILLGRMMVYLQERDSYEATVRHIPNAKKWYGNATQFITFGLELQVVQKLYALIKPPPPPEHRKFSDAEMERLKKADIEVRAKLEAKGVDTKKFPKLEELLERQNLYNERGEFGNIANDLKEGLIHFNAVDYLLFCYIMHYAENKTKAGIEFAMYFAVCSGSSVLIGVFERAFTALALRAAGAGYVRLGRVLNFFSKAPGPVKFVIVIAIMLGLSKYIDEWATWIDKKIPESRAKLYAGHGLNILALGSAFDVITLLDIANGGLKDKVENETTMMNTLGMKMGNSRELTFDQDTWDNSVQAAEKKQASPIIEKIYDLELINLPTVGERDAMRKRNDGSWEEAWKENDRVRMWSFDAFRTVRSLRSEEIELQNDLQKEGIVQSPYQMPSIVGFLTDDTTPFTAGETLDTQLGWALAGNSNYSSNHPLCKLNQRIRQSGKSEVIKKWDSLIQESCAFAKDLSVFRHLQVYDRNTWFGPSENFRQLETLGITEFAHSGLEAKAAYVIKKHQALEYAGAGSVPDFAVDLARQTRPVQEIDGSLILKTLTDFAGMIDSVLKNFDKFNMKHPIDSFVPGVVGLYDHFKERESEELIEQEMIRMKDGLMQSSKDLGEYFRGAKYDEKTAEEFNRILEPVSAIVARFAERRPTMTEMRGAQEAITRAISLASQKEGGKLAPVPDDLRKYLPLTAEQPCFISGGYDLGIRALYIRAFQDSEDLKPALGRKLNLVVLNSSRHESVVTASCFSCDTVSRNGWMVTTHTAQERWAMDGTGIGTIHSPEMEFTDWVKQFPDQAKQLEPTFQKLFEEFQQSILPPSKEEIERQKHRLDRANFSYDEFREIDNQTKKNRMLYDIGGKQVAVDTTIGGAFNEPEMTPDGWVKVNHPFRFTIVDTGISWNVYGGFWNQKNLSDEQKSMIRGVLTTPLEDRDDAPLHRILNIYPSYVYTPSAVTSLIFSSRNYKRELFDAVRPLYHSLPAEKKKKFLDELWRNLEAWGKIHGGSVDDIVKDLKSQDWN